MASVNKVILMGNCGRDPEVRRLPSGGAVANISIATTIRRKDKVSGQTIEETQWHRVQFFERLAEIVGEYVKKGSSIYVEGRLRYGKYTDKDGIERSTVDVLATEMQLLGSREASSSESIKKAESNPNVQKARPANQGSGFDDMDDDLPF